MFAAEVRGMNMLKIKKFKNYDEFEKYSDKLQEKDKNFPNNVIAIIETDTHISADVMVVCKKKKTAAKRFFESVKDYPDLAAWDGWFNTDNEDDEHAKDERFNYMTEKNDYTGNYSIGIENFEDRFYIFMNMSKEYKELTGLQYDFDYCAEKSIEWNKQTEKIQKSVVNRYENELRGEWVYKFCNSEELIKNIKIERVYRDRVSGEIYFSYNYTVKGYKGTEESWRMRVTVENGKIINYRSTDKFTGLAESALNEDILSYISRVTPEFSYLEE